MGNLSQSITAFTAPIHVDVKIVQVGGFGQQSYQLALTRTVLQVSASSIGCLHFSPPTLPIWPTVVACERCIT